MCDEITVIEWQLILNVQDSSTILSRRVVGGPSWAVITLKRRRLNATIRESLCGNCPFLINELVHIVSCCTRYRQHAAAAAAADINCLQLDPEDATAHVDWRMKPKTIRQ